MPNCGNGMLNITQSAAIPKHQARKRMESRRKAPRISNARAESKLVMNMPLFNPEMRLPFLAYKKLEWLQSRSGDSAAWNGTPDIETIACRNID
jgi:hypothetical protein